MRINLAFRYAAFAVLASSVNLASQWISFHLYRGVGELAVGVIAGTSTGLITKYCLDKFWIFDDRGFGLAENLQKFTYYSITGVLTTMIFWGTEAVFALYSDHKALRYLGAAIGLFMGYVTKFHLDYRFVFRVRA